MSKRKHHVSGRAAKHSQDGAASAPLQAESVQHDDALAGFAGPGYGGFGGSAGYSGSGVGGITGGYAGGGYFDSSDWNEKGETRHDDRIHDDVTARLALSEDVDATAIEVTVQAGVVTLSGEVETRHMKHIARDIAAAVPGVASVHNRLHVEQGLLDELRERLSPERPTGH